jgi:hypothetical protein
MNFSLDKFLKPLTDADRNIKIYNNNSIVQFTINPFSVTRTNVSNNLLKINLRYNIVHVLDFRTPSEAKLALIELQAQLDVLRNYVPYSIDKQIQNYVDFNDNMIITNQSVKSEDVFIENIWVESNLIPTSIIDALNSPIVASISTTMSFVQSSSYSFVINQNQKTRVVPTRYGTFYEPLLFSSVDGEPISATGIPRWEILEDVITFYGGFPSVPVVGPSNPPVIQYFEYIGRLGSFNLIGGLTNIIETTSGSNIIQLTQNIRRDNIISVTVNGLLIYRWEYNSLNQLIIDESELGYEIQTTDTIRIETNIEPGGTFSFI